MKRSQEVTEAGRKIISVDLIPGVDLDEKISAAEQYMQVRQAKKHPTYVHPDLEPILKDTYGVIVYQEQVMKVLVDLCDYTLEETDRIRDAIAKKKHEVMMKAFDRIREATGKRGWTSEQSDALCQTIMAFSRYSFNLSHSHAYAELGYITMYLKHHHPLEWWASVLNNEDKEDKVRGFISLLGDTVRPPSLKTPSDKFLVVDDHITAPISAIKRVGPAAYKELAAKGPFVDLIDYIKRVEHSKVNKGVIEALVKARAADSMMDQTISRYADRKQKFLDDYALLRKSKIEWKDEVRESHPLKIFFLEKDVNKTFNKHLLSDKDVRKFLMDKWPILKETGRQGIPFMMGRVPIINNLSVAEGLLKQDHNQDVGMIMLYEGSKVRKGNSKRTGKPYHFVNVTLSDGYNIVECTDWNRKSALKFPKQSIVYVKGTLKEGFRNPVSITIKEIQVIE